MAKEAGLSDALWHPGSAGLKSAQDLLPLLKRGLQNLLREPDRFKILNPANGWGDYDGLVRSTEECLKACQRNPKASIFVSL